MENHEDIYDFPKHSEYFMNIINLTNIVLYMHSTLLYLFHLLIHIKICIVFMEDGVLEVYKGGIIKGL